MFKLQSLIFISLSSVLFNAMADDVNPGKVDASIPVEEYTYSTHLDVAKVISMSATPNVCGVVPATMVYEDSQGHRHAMVYQIMGDGCSNG